MTAEVRASIRRRCAWRAWRARGKLHPLDKGLELRRCIQHPCRQRAQVIHGIAIEMKRCRNGAKPISVGGIDQMIEGQNGEIDGHFPAAWTAPLIDLSRPDIEILLCQQRGLGIQHIGGCIGEGLNRVEQAGVCLRGSTRVGPHIRQCCIGMPSSL